MISRRNIIKLFLIFFISFILIEKSFSSEAEKFVQLTVDKASDVLSDNSSKEEKIDKLKNIAKETVDINGIGLYTLGSHRKNISSEQKQEYAILFKEYFLDAIKSSSALYLSLTFCITGMFNFFPRAETTLFFSLEIM